MPLDPYIVITVPVSIVASIRRCHRRDRGSIPRQEALFVHNFNAFSSNYDRLLLDYFATTAERNRLEWRALDSGPQHRLACTCGTRRWSARRVRTPLNTHLPSIPRVMPIASKPFCFSSGPATLPRCGAPLMLPPEVGRRVSGPVPHTDAPCEPRNKARPRRRREEKGGSGGYPPGFALLFKGFHVHPKREMSRWFVGAMGRPPRCDQVRRGRLRACGQAHGAGSKRPSLIPPPERQRKELKLLECSCV